MAKKKAPNSKQSRASSSSSRSSASAKTTIQRVCSERLVLRIKSSGERTRRSTRLMSQKEKRPEGSLGAKRGTQKKKKMNGKADAKMPKKPPTAFFYFLEDFRKEFQEQNPDVKSMRDVGKACGEKWKTMTYEEKVKYYDIATEKRAEFDRAMAAYIKRKESGEDDESGDDSEFDE